jgi:uncharacterized membrane protein YedE/YeeE
MTSLKTGLGPLLGGMLFSIGLGVSGMTEPAKIISFLDIFGDWDPSLIFVMVGAIGVNAILHRFITKKTTPLFDSKFHLPTKTQLDKKLLIGSALFGIGWGITGLCPGPGLAAASTGQPYPVAFVVSLVTGMALVKWFDSKKSQPQKQRTQ